MLLEPGIYLPAISSFFPIRLTIFSVVEKKQARIRIPAAFSP